MPTISVILVNYNGERLLDDCLTSLANQTYRDFEVLFVDNSSADRSVARAQELMPAIRIIRLETNTGFATGNNVGMRAATGTHIVLLNNDTEADPRFLEELAAAIERDPKAGMVAPKILNFFERSQIDSVGGLLVSADGIGIGRGRCERDAGQLDGLTEALVPSGCAALYRKAMLDEIGLFPDNFFAYCEDADLGLRGLRAGWTTVTAPRAIVYHKYSASSGGLSPFKLYLVERNHYLLAVRCLPLRMLLLVPLVTLYRYWLMGCVVLSGKGKGKAAAGGKTGALLVAFLKAHAMALWMAPRHFFAKTGPRRMSAGAFAKLLARHRASLRQIFMTE